jgi:hypothetical protein
VPVTRPSRNLRFFKYLTKLRLPLTNLIFTMRLN